MAVWPRVNRVTPVWTHSGKLTSAETHRALRVQVHSSAQSLKPWERRLKPGVQHLHPPGCCAPLAHLLVLLMMQLQCLRVTPHVKVGTRSICTKERKWLTNNGKNSASYGFPYGVHESGLHFLGMNALPVQVTSSSTLAATWEVPESRKLPEAFGVNSSLGGLTENTFFMPSSGSVQAHVTCRVRRPRFCRVRVLHMMAYVRTSPKWMAPASNSLQIRRDPKPIAWQGILYMPPSKVILIMSLNFSVSSINAVTCHNETN